MFFNQLFCLVSLWWLHCFLLVWVDAFSSLVCEREIREICGSTEEARFGGRKKNNLPFEQLNLRGMCGVI
jgi:hypothetical protein